MVGTHRGRRSLSSRLPGIGASVVAVALVVLVITLVRVLHHSAGHTARITTTPSTTASTPTPTVTVTPTLTVKPTPTVKHPVPVVTPPPARTPLVVYNISRVEGRAALAARRLRAAGYPVLHVADRRYATATSVVYYDAGNASEAAAARGVVARHLGITVAAVRPTGIPATGGLIVLVTATYH